VEAPPGHRRHRRLGGCGLLREVRDRSWALGPGDVCLDVAALHAREVLQQASGDFEGLSDGNERVAKVGVDFSVFTMGRLGAVVQYGADGGFVTDDDRGTPRHGELQPHVEVAAVLPMPVRHLDQCAACQQAATEAFEVCHSFKDEGFESIGVRQMAERDMRLECGHGVSLA
jgi:hypothetical protein